MYNIAKSEKENRIVYFENTAARKSIDVNIIEKDFYVCLLLNYLFDKCKYKNYFTFKGGTSLSKAFHVIERFSEDIDIILDFDAINLDRKKIYEKKSNTQSDKLMEEIDSLNKDFLINKLMPLLIEELNEEMKMNLNIKYNERDDSIIIHYDNIYKNDYVLPEIKLEISPRADKIPNHKVLVKPYIAEYYGNRMDIAETNVSIVDLERTFWEKITILHKLANWSLDKPLPNRYSRHYYDVFCMIGRGVKENAFRRKGLLEQDIKFKEIMYRSNTSGYETAKIGTLMLVPKSEHYAILKNDYSEMKYMIFGKQFEWEEIVNGIKLLEAEINTLG